MSRSELLRRISVEPNVCGGKPVIRGTRILVEIILDALAEGLTPEQVIDHYPNLMLDDIHAALAYADDSSTRTGDLKALEYVLRKNAELYRRLA